MTRITSRPLLYALLALLIVAPSAAHATRQIPKKPVDEAASPQLRPAPLEQWKAMSIDKRRALIAEWEKLDERTRPAFPVYRDAALEEKDAPEGSLTRNK